MLVNHAKNSATILLQGERDQATATGRAQFDYHSESCPEWFLLRFVPEKPLAGGARNVPAKRSISEG
jgi:hypothetical protein